MTRVEYLTILTITEKSNTFCDSISTFNNFLQADSDLVIRRGEIKFKGKFSCDYKITSGEIPGKKQRYFHTQFSIDGSSENDLIAFSDFLKTVRTLLSIAGNQPETLWDDISFHYSRLAYDIIYKIENLMRKLIANFMLVTIGIQWVEEATPVEIKEVINKGKRKDYINVLHNIDFIHLANFLIKPYSKITQTELSKKINAANSLEDIYTLKDSLPESNWNRYFSSLVNCDDSYLQKRWGELYELRCKVAHNAIVTRADFEEINSLANELEKKLKDALNKLPQVKVPETEVTNIAENAAGNLSSTHNSFIESWQQLDKYLSERLEGYGQQSFTVAEAGRLLRQVGIFDEEQENELKKIQITRNHIVHPADSTIISEAEINNSIESMQNLIEVIRNFSE